MEPLNLLGLRFLIAFLILFIIFFKKNCITIRKNPRILAAALLLGGILLPNIKGRRPQHATPLSNVPNSMRHSPDW